MRPILLILALVGIVLIASSADAGGFLNLSIGRNRSFGRQQVFVQQPRVIVQQQRFFVPQRRVIVQQQFVPAYGVQTFGGGFHGGSFQSFGFGFGY